MVCDIADVSSIVEFECSIAGCLVVCRGSGVCWCSIVSGSAFVACEFVEVSTECVVVTCECFLHSSYSASICAGCGEVVACVAEAQ